MIKQTMTPQPNVTLTQQQQQSLKLLEMSQIELTEYVDNELLENPLLELDEDQFTKQDDFLLQVSRFLEQSTPFVREGVYVDQTSYELNPPICNYNPRDEIKEQLYVHHADPLLQHTAEQLIPMLNLHGFLPYEDKEIASLLRCNQATVATAREILCDLEPFGIASKNMGDFFVRQLKQRHQLTPALKAICTQYLSQVAQKEYKQIAVALSLDVAQVKAYVQQISTLTPFPILLDLQAQETEYLVPDLFVKKEKGILRLYLNDRYSHSLSISSLYHSYAKQDATPEVQQYLKEKIERAKHMIAMIEKRNTTLFSIGEKILENQTSFFETLSLYPYPQSKMAEELSLSNSTISRAIKGKYLQCQWGTFPLKSFFSLELANNPDQSKKNIKEKLQQLIQSEPKSKPYSDQQLVSLLVQEGITLSRRTVAKYRNECGIGGTSERKEQ